MSEKTIQTKKCKNCQTPFDITDKDIEFYDKVSPTFAGKKYQIPAPTLCPDCRQQRRMSFRNERKLYRRKCDISGKEVISIYNPDSPFKICDRHIRWSDTWDPMQYGRVFDMSKDFFSQFEKLWQETPNVALYNVNTINSEYANHCLNEKNCYMIFGSYENEDCMYGEGMGRSKDCMDLLRGMYLNSCYECVDTKSSYKVFRGQKCNDCSESYFLYNCNNCHHCVGCINLVNQSYCIENTQYSKEEYVQKLADLNVKNHSRIEHYKQKFSQIIKSSIHKFADVTNCEDVTGDNLVAVKNSQYCFDMKDARDCKYCAHVMEMNDVYDAYGAGATASLMYEAIDTGLDESKVAFTIVVYQSTDAYYCINCHGCHNIFGCVGLRNKEYCILNKQYTKAEYEKLVPQIIEKMCADKQRGEFFPSAISPFAYNETIANDYFPLPKEEALQGGFRRLGKEYSTNLPQGLISIQAQDLPQQSKDISDDILKQIIICEVTGKPFRIVKTELEFYRKHHLPLPHRHPDQRHTDRMALRNPRKLFDRKCDKCGADIKTTYNPDRPEIVYCEVCYNKEIYG